MSKKFEIAGNDISDGYHTFDELYQHRNLLFLNLCLNDSSNCRWRPHYEGWFVLYWETIHGQISYHLPIKFVRLVDGKIERDDNYQWDGHSPSNVLERLRKNAE